MRTLILTAAFLFISAFAGASVEGFVQRTTPTVVPGAGSIPAGTVLHAVLRQPLGSRVNGVGDRVAVDLVRPVETPDGFLVIPLGTTVHGRITAIARPATRGNQVAIGVRFDELIYEGRPLSLRSEVARIDHPPARLGGLDHSDGYRSVGRVISKDDAVALTGIDFQGGATVISLGMGDAEPLVPLGTTIHLRLREGLQLR